MAGNNKQIFLDIIKDYNKKLSFSEMLSSKVLVWTEDYEREWYLIYSEIPDAAKWFWVNRFRTYCYKFERNKGKWEMVEKGKAMTEEEQKQIRTGPAFDHAPILLDPPKVASWF